MPDVAVPQIAPSLPPSGPSWGLWSAAHRPLSSRSGGHAREGFGRSKAPSPLGRKFPWLPLDCVPQPVYVLLIPCLWVLVVSTVRCRPSRVFHHRPSAVIRGKHRSTLVQGRPFGFLGSAVRLAVMRPTRLSSHRMTGEKAKGVESSVHLMTGEEAIQRHAPFDWKTRYGVDVADQLLESSSAHPHVVSVFTVDAVPVNAPM